MLLSTLWLNAFIDTLILVPIIKNNLTVLLRQNYQQPAECWLTASVTERACLIPKKFTYFFVISHFWNSGLPFVEVTPTVSHKHSLADCLPSQCWHWHFPSLSGRLIFMYFYCNYMAEFFIYIFPKMPLFSPTGAFHPQLQIKLSYCQHFLLPRATENKIPPVNKR